MNKTELSTQYLELLKKSLVNELYLENELRLLYTFSAMLQDKPLEYNAFLHIREAAPNLLNLLRQVKITGDTIVLGGEKALRNVTELSHSMIGKKRLENIQYCMETVLSEGIQGDFIETGIWRGGACIFMRGILKAYNITDRFVWAADSFEGVPVPSLPEDAQLDISRNVLPVLAVSLDEVQELFERYDLLDEQVKFLIGWFKDSLPDAPIEQLAVLRLDGDLYESTMDALNPLYDKVSVGGFIIVDDYGSCPPCKQAIHDFRCQRGIRDELISIDTQSVFWRKS